MRIIGMSEFPVLSEYEHIDKAKAKLAAAEKAVIVVNEKKSFYGIIDEFVLIKNIFRSVSLSSICFMPPRINLDEQLPVNIYNLGRAQSRIYPVYKGEKLVGFVSRGDMLEEASSLFSGTIGSLARNLEFVALTANLSEVLRVIVKDRVNTIAVAENGKIEGYITPFSLLGVADFGLKGIIPSERQAGSIVLARDLISRKVAIMDESTPIPEAIAKLRGIGYGVVTREGKPIGSISLFDIANSLKKPDLVDVAVQGLDEEETILAQQKISLVLEKVAKTYSVKRASLSAKKQGHSVYVMHLKVDDGSHFDIESNVFMEGINHLVESLKNKYLLAKKGRDKG